MATDDLANLDSLPTERVLRMARMLQMEVRAAVRALGIRHVRDEPSTDRAILALAKAGDERGAEFVITHTALVNTIEKRKVPLPRGFEPTVSMDEWLDLPSPIRTRQGSRKDIPDRDWVTSIPDAYAEGRTSPVAVVAFLRSRGYDKKTEHVRAVLHDIERVRPLIRFEVGTTVDKVVAERKDIARRLRRGETEDDFGGPLKVPTESIESVVVSRLSRLGNGWWRRDVLRAAVTIEARIEVRRTTKRPPVAH